MEPIACSLAADAVPERVAQWRRLAAAAASVERGRGVVRLELPAGAAADVAALCAAEVACCPFFTFTVTMTGTATSLTIEVPPDAAAVLDELVG